MKVKRPEAYGKEGLIDVVDVVGYCCWMAVLQITIVKYEKRYNL